LKERLLNGQPVGNKALNKRKSNPRFFKKKAAEKEKF
jgi:hypothetical protein|tara:strand:- start:2390 stop:2500 length:111 start_codon:yes stop_codon:yes gene_type:complete